MVWRAEPGGGWCCAGAGEGEGTDRGLVEEGLLCGGALRPRGGGETLPDFLVPVQSLLVPYPIPMWEETMPKTWVSRRRKDWVVVVEKRNPILGGSYSSHSQRKEEKEGSNSIPMPRRKLGSCPGRTGGGGGGERWRQGD